MIDGDKIRALEDELCFGLRIAWPQAQSVLKLLVWKLPRYGGKFIIGSPHQTMRSFHTLQCDRRWPKVLELLAKYGVEVDPQLLADLSKQRRGRVVHDFPRPFSRRPSLRLKRFWKV